MKNRTFLQVFVGALFVTCCACGFTGHVVGALLAGIVMCIAAVESLHYE